MIYLVAAIVLAAVVLIGTAYRTMPPAAFPLPELDPDCAQTRAWLYSGAADPDLAEWPTVITPTAGRPPWGERVTGPPPGSRDWAIDTARELAELPQAPDPGTPPCPGGGQVSPVDAGTEVRAVSPIETRTSVPGQPAGTEFDRSQARYVAAVMASLNADVAEYLDRLAGG